MLKQSNTKNKVKLNIPIDKLDITFLETRYQRLTCKSLDERTSGKRWGRV